MVPAQEVPHHVGGLKRVVIRPFPTFLLVGRSRPIVATISDGEVFNVDSRATKLSDIVQASLAANPPPLDLPVA